MSEEIITTENMTEETSREYTESPVTEQEPSKDTADAEETAETAETEQHQLTEEERLFAGYVNATIEAGIEPIEMRFAQINTVYPPEPVAYRSFTYLNSVTAGVTGPELYAPLSDASEAGIKLAKWNITHALRAARKMQLAGRRIQFVTARCPYEICFEGSLYDTVKALAEEQGLSPETICLEFPSGTLRVKRTQERQQIRQAFLDMKLLGVKTMISGIGDSDISPAEFFEIPADLYVLDPSITSMAAGKIKGASVAALAAFLKSLSAEIVGDGVYNDSQMNALLKNDCRYYIPSSGYRGSVQHGSLRMKLEEAIAQHVEED